VTVQRALAGTNFPVLIPTHPLANAQNVTAAYLYPQGVAIVLQFPPAEVPAQPVLQDFIELFEAPWESGEPMTDYLTDIREDPAVGKDIFQIGDVPALGVTAHSPSAADRSNAAFLRFVRGGVEIQLSGGESIDKLLDIAKTIVAASVTPSPKASEAPSQNPSPAQPPAPSESPSPTGSPTT
jgi:hypothetical protein